MPWTTGYFSRIMHHLLSFLLELKSGHLPEGITRRMGFWKAEEYQKFTFPASECILEKKLPDENYCVWVLIVRIVEMIFTLGRDGWTEESLDLLEKLIRRYCILTEETHGISNRVI